VQLLPLVAWRGLSRTGQEARIAEWAGLASDAAACAIAAGRLEQAVELLELGRSVLWNRLLETRTDLSDLYQRYPQLAARLDEARAELDAPGSDAPLRRARRLRAALAWEQTVTEVRALPGHADFLRPAPFLSLRGAVQGGTAVIINLSDLRCDALVITASGVGSVPLPEITLKDVAAAADTCATAISTLATETATLAGQRTARRVIHDTLAWLYDTVAGPVLDMTQGRRVWWCPTRALTQLPLQAAGHHVDGSRRTVLDRVVSSTIPSLGALSRALPALAASGPDGAPAGAGQPATMPPKLLITVVPQARAWSRWPAQTGRPQRWGERPHARPSPPCGDRKLPAMLSGRPWPVTRSLISPATACSTSPSPTGAASALMTEYSPSRKSPT